MRRTRSVPFRDVASVEPGLTWARSAHRTRLRGHRRRPRPAGREGGFPSARSGEVRPEAAEHGLAPTLVWQREGPLVAENHRNQRNGDAARRRRKGDFETRRFPGGQGGPGPLPSFPNSNDFSPRKRVTHVEPPSAEAGPARRAQRTPALREVPSHLTDEASCGADGTSRGNPAYANPGLTETGRFRGEF